MSDASNNASCPCGSGARIEECCGKRNGLAHGQSPGDRAATLLSIKRSALMAYREGALDGAERLCRTFLAASPDDAEVLHLLGQVRHVQGDSWEALVLVQRAGELTEWAHPALSKNVGHIIEGLQKLVGADRNPEVLEKKSACTAWVSKVKAEAISANPLVSVIVPSYNHGRYVEEALRSVFAQRYRNIELIVIDDGSQDGSPEIISRCIRHCPFENTVVARDNRGAVATIQEGLSLARGEFFNVLHSDDAFHPDRLATLVREVAAKGNQWGFTSVGFIDAGSREIERSDDYPIAYLTRQLARAGADYSIGMALLSENISISTGNLFISRSFHERIGGFHPLIFTEDWEFCLRATRYAEPVFVPEKLFRYRFHGKNTILRDRESATKEADSVFREYCREALNGRPWPNPFAPSCAVWGDAFLCRLLCMGLPLREEFPDVGRAMLDRWRALAPGRGGGSVA